jgi:hypothetical protein
VRKVEGRLQQNVEAVMAVHGDLGNGTEDSLSLRSADLERLVQALVEGELDPAVSAP